MKIIILEGIATSGKTSIQNLLISEFEKRNIDFAVVDENQTLMQILENTDKSVSVKFLLKILNKFFALNKDVLIFDRLYFTHVFRTSSTIDDFAEIEDLLAGHDALLVLLTIDEQKISDRVQSAMLYRGQKWANFVRRKGNDSEIESYYVQQQQFLLKLSSKSRLPHVVENSTAGDFEKITKTILKKINNEC